MELSLYCLEKCGKSKNFHCVYITNAQFPLEVFFSILQKVKREELGKWIYLYYFKQTRIVVSLILKLPYTSSIIK